jgi:type IV pilus assembly protein PilE
MHLQKRNQRMHTQLARRPQRGFSLIELLVVVAIVAILASISVASYRRYTLRANRTEARIALLQIQAGQEKFFLQNNGYATDVATLIAAPPNGLGLNLTAAGLTPSGFYTLSFTAAAANAYTVQAVATGKQTDDTAACQTFTINDAGLRTPADSTGCWK